MVNTKGIFWLSSYPKSGNTWFRIFLGNLLSLSGLIDRVEDNEQSSNKHHDASTPPLHLNHVDDLINDHITTSRIWVNQACGFNTANLTDNELDTLLPTLYTWYSAQQPKITYHKIHKAYTYVGNNQPLIPHKGCLGIIYFIRNPLDIAISLANHFFCTIDDAIKMMGDKSYALYHYPLRQLLFSWSMHVNSWVEAKEINILFLRYEDMIAKSLESFTKAAQFLQLNVTRNRIEQAIAHASFDKLQQFENDIGFMDKPPKLKNFFRKGIAGDWQTMLTADQIKRMIDDHGEVMQKFGYLNKQNEPMVG